MPVTVRTIVGNVEQWLNAASSPDGVGHNCSQWEFTQFFL